MRARPELFEEAAAASGLDYSRLDARRCYMLERVHPAFRIVISYGAPALWHVGTRDIHSLREVHDDEVGLPRPRRWEVHSLGQARALLGLHDSAEIGEGLVLREPRTRSGAPGPRRLKLKRAEYVWLHDCSCGGGRSGKHE